MSETYDSDFLVKSLQLYIAGREDGSQDGYEFQVEPGFNQVDPLYLIKYAKLDATFEEQVMLMKSMIVGKKVTIILFGVVIGSFQLSSVDQGFGAFDIFTSYPAALDQLIKTCWISSLKNLIPPLNASQLAAKEAMRVAREELAKSSGTEKR